MPAHLSSVIQRRAVMLTIVCVIMVSFLGVATPPPVAAQSSPFQVLQSGSKYFVKVDLRDSRVQPQVVLANNNQGGLETLASMKTRLDGQYSEYIIVNGDVFGQYDSSGNRCPSNVNCAQGLTVINGQKRDNWLAYGDTWKGRGNIGFDSNRGVDITVGDSQTKRHMTIAGGPRVVMGGRATCNFQYVANNKIYFPDSGEYFDADAARWCGTAHVTLVGYNADRSQLFIGVSTGGESIFQVADWLIQQGAVEVLRFDGGSSTGLYHNNTSRGTTGKPIPNALAIAVANTGGGGGGGGETPTCPAPEPIAPAANYTADSLRVSFSWNPVNCNHGNKYRLWIMRDGGGDVVDPPLVEGTATTVDIPAKYAGQLLYWRVGAEISGRRASNLRPFRVGTAAPTPQPAMPPSSDCLKPLLRYWNESRQKHFYTANPAELGFGQNGWVLEGAEGYVSATPDCQRAGAVPLYRLYHQTRDKHFYTADEAELAFVIATWGFVVEGPIGYVMTAQTPDTTPMYRLYQDANDDHFYTIKPAERDLSVNQFGYRNEGVAMYVFTEQSLLPPENDCLKPLLRYWHSGLQRHFYTANRAELGVAAGGWVFEKAEGYIAKTATCYAPGALPLYRFWSDARQKHFYTISEAEARYVEQDLGFRAEGSIGYILPVADSTYATTPLYRHYSPNTGDHFYTISTGESAAAVNFGYRAEGVAGYAFAELRDPPVTSPAPQVAVNYAEGAPLSSFILSASGLDSGSAYRVLITPPDATEPIFYGTISSNGTYLNLQLITDQATLEGTYVISLVPVERNALLQADELSVAVTIAAEAPLRSDGLLDPLTPSFVISPDVEPPGDPFWKIYLPLLRQ